MKPIIEPKNMSQEINSPLYQHGALLDPQSFAFHPLNYALGLADAIEKHGGTIYENSEVKSIKKRKGRYEIDTVEGKIQSTEVVIATNGYTTKNIENKLTKSVIPIESHIITTEQLPKDITNHLIPQNRVIIDTNFFLLFSNN